LFFAPLTSIVNKFGGQWYDENWQAQVDAPGFRNAIQFYLDTLKAGGEADPVSYGFTESLNLVGGAHARQW
jgi:sorbitol/mannitol transport system substrate-binding protein